MSEYTERFYRYWIKNGDLVSFEVSLKESDLFIRVEKDLKRETLSALKEVRETLENYIKEDPVFLKTLKPHLPKPDAPKIVKEMAKMSRRVKVGPMASVAGAVAEWVGKKLTKWSSEVIVENGGDIYLISQKERMVKVFPGDSKFRDSIVIKVKPEQTPLGICTSSGKVGPSLSFGKADAVVVLSPSVILADAAATSICNKISSEKDIKKAIMWGSRVKGITGLLILMGGNMGVWGDIELSHGGE